jgi:hypothetical protein
MLTNEILRAANLLPHGWENDQRLVVLARDMDPDSGQYGALLYAGTRATFDSINPQLSNVAVHPVDQTIRRGEGQPFVMNRDRYTFERGDLVGWYVRTIGPSFNARQLPALEAATDWEAAWAQFLGVTPEVVLDALDKALGKAPAPVAQLNVADSPADASERAFAESVFATPDTPDAPKPLSERLAEYTGAWISSVAGRDVELGPSSKWGELFRELKELEARAGSNVSPDAEAGLRRRMAHAINFASRESVSNTPDFILADLVADQLAAFERASLRREEWYGKSLRPGGQVADAR